LVPSQNDLSHAVTLVKQKTMMLYPSTSNDAPVDIKKKIEVSVVVLTYNEAINITGCLRALESFDDVLVVDSGSTDGTQEIIRHGFPDIRLLTNPFEDFGQQRNWALDHGGVRNSWILFVDADEFLEAPIVEEIRAFVRNPGDSVGAYIAGRNYFLGKWIKRCTYFPSYQLRLLKHGEVRYRKEGHGQREVSDGKLIYLKNTWRHEAFSHGISDWIQKHNRYSSAEIELTQRLRQESISIKKLVFGNAIEMRREAKKLFNRIPGRPVWRFLHSYFIRFGFLDGYQGWIFSLLRFSHELHIVAKEYESKYSKKEIHETRNK
jgi:glycosyltransferase involved in cell wall biosynthesis